MKKTLQLMLLVLAVIMFSCTKNTYEKDIVGTWEAFEEEPGGEKFYHTLTFNEDGSFEQMVLTESMERESGILMDITLSIRMPGTWKIKGNTMTIKFDGTMEIIDYTMDYPELGDEEKAQALLFFAENEVALKEEMIAAMINDIPKGDQLYSDLKVTPETLSYNTLDGIESFTRKK